MPLIRNCQYVAPDLYDYHQRNHWFQADAIRTLFDGRLLSLRSPHMRDSVVQRSLAALAEEDVIIDGDIIGRYASAQALIGLEMSALFRVVNKVGVLPQPSSALVPVTWGGDTPRASAGAVTHERLSDLAFYPVAADFVASSNYVLFRVVRVGEVADTPSRVITPQTSGVIGLCRETIASLSRDLHDYIGAIEAKAVMASECTRALNDLNARLRPHEAKAREFREKQVAYGPHFGTWG